MVVADNREIDLHLEQLLLAPSECVFDACVDPEKLAEWFGPNGFTAVNVELQAHEGGRYRITLQPPEGDAFHIGGEFRAIERARRLVYTFEYEEPDPDDQETVVTIAFLEDGGGTRLILDQGPFATEARRALHDTGWTETLARLERFLA